MIKSKKVKKNKLSSLNSLNKYLWKYKLYLIGGFFFIILSNYFRILQPQYLRLAIDEVLNLIPIYKHILNVENRLIFKTFFSKHLFLFGIFVFGLAILMGLFMYFMRQTIIVMSRLIERDIRQDLYDFCQNLDLSYFQSQMTGNMMTILTEDVSKVRSYLGPAIMYGINLFTLICLSVTAMFRINTTLALITLAPLPFLSIGIYLVSNQINKRSGKIQQKLSGLNAMVVEIFSGIRIVKSYSLESKLNLNFNEQNENFYLENIKRARIDALFYPIMVLVIGLTTILILYFGGLQVKYGIVTPGNIAEFLIYINLLTWPITSLGWTASLVQQAAASQERINDFYNQKSTLVQGVSFIKDKKFEIEFKNVTFGFNETENPAIRNFNFKFQNGEKIAIVGRTASGKSTFARLLMQFFQPLSGEILLNNIPIQKYAIQSWRSLFGYAQQESFLFSETIENNIAFGIENFDEKSNILTLLQNVNFINEVNQMPDKHHTLIGERGVTLSGGQKQRTAIARAIAMNPKILILDDSLSAVDNLTFEKLHTYLNTKLIDSTIILITQSFRNIEQFSRIILMDKGNIIADGTHSQLLLSSSLYQKLYELYERGRDKSENI